MSIRNNYPAIAPSLVLDFANSRYLDPRLSYTRSSIATYTDEDGYVKTVLPGTPRFDYDPITRRCRGLLIEESRTNVYSHSDVSNASWALDNTSPGGGRTANSGDTLDPAGTNTSTKLTTSSSGASATQVYRTISAGSHGVQSVWAKAGTAPTLGIYRYSGTGGIGAWFNLSTGQHRVAGASTAVNAGEQSTSGNFTSRMIAYPNGWYRCIFRDTNTNMTYCHLRICDFGSDTFAAATNSSLYLWGAQGETGGVSWASSLIPTTGTSATRNADVLTMAYGYVSQWYKQIEGTYVFSFYNYEPGSPTTRILVDSGFQNSPNVYLPSGGNSAKLGINAAIGGNEVTIAINSNIKLSAAYSTTESPYLRISSGDNTNTTVTQPSPNLVNMLYFGNRNDGLYLNSSLGRVEYYPRFLTESQMRSITLT